MTPNDFNVFRDAMCGAWLTITSGRDEPPQAVMDVFWRAFANVPIERFCWAMEQHLRDPKHGEFLPKPASIERWLREAQSADGRPDADEAWGIALVAESEAATVVWTPEIRAAWAVAEPIAVGGRDKVGARKTFISTYERLVAASRAKGEPVRWDVSNGTDAHQRVPALEEAARLNRIASADAVALIEMVRPMALPSPLAAHVAGEAGPVAGLLAQVAESVSDEEGARRIAGIKAMLAANRAQREAEEVARGERRLEISKARIAGMMQARAALGEDDSFEKAQARVMKLNGKVSKRATARAV